MTSKTMTNKALFIAVLGIAMSAFLPAQAQAQTQAQICKDTAIACGATAGGGLLVCAAAAAQEGFNPIADIACSKLADAAIGSCLAMPIVCAKVTGAQPAIGTRTVAGSTSGTVDETKICPGSNRVSGLDIRRENGRVRKITFKCTDGTKLNTGPALGTTVGNICANGRMSQGGGVLTLNGYVTGFDIKCDYALDSTTADTTFRVGRLEVGGTNNDRLCTEGQYLVGYRAWHGGSNSYLTGISFLCRGMPFKK